MPGCQLKHARSSLLNTWHPLLRKLTEVPSLLKDGPHSTFVPAGSALNGLQRGFLNNPQVDKPEAPRQAMLQVHRGFSTDEVTDSLALNAQISLRIPLRGEGRRESSCFPSSRSSLELSDANVYGSSIRALLGTTAHFCKVVVLKSRTDCLSPDLMRELSLAMQVQRITPSCNCPDPVCIYTHVNVQMAVYVLMAMTVYVLDKSTSLIVQSLAMQVQWTTHDAMLGVCDQERE